MERDQRDAQLVVLPVGDGALQKFCRFRPDEGQIILDQQVRRPVIGLRGIDTGGKIMLVLVLFSH